MRNVFTISIMQTGPRNFEMKPVSIWIQHLLGEDTVKKNQ